MPLPTHSHNTQRTSALNNNPRQLPSLSLLLPLLQGATAPSNNHPRARISQIKRARRRRRS